MNNSVDFFVRLEDYNAIIGFARDVIVESVGVHWADRHPQMCPHPLSCRVASPRWIDTDCMRHPTELNCECELKQRAQARELFDRPHAFRRAISRCRGPVDRLFFHVPQ